LQDSLISHPVICNPQLHHSYLKFSAGFAVAARIACQLTVNDAIVSASAVARMNIHQLYEVLVKEYRPIVHARAVYLMDCNFLCPAL
jgi:hypothetical protein